MKIYLLYQLIALIVRNILSSLRTFEEEENGKVAFWKWKIHIINEDLFTIQLVTLVVYNILQHLNHLQWNFYRVWGSLRKKKMDDLHSELFLNEKYIFNYS